MNISHFAITDNNLFSIIVLILIISNTHTGKRGASYTARFMLLMCWTTIAVLTMDFLSWLFLDSEGTMGWYLVYLSNFFLFLLNPTAPVAWLMYSYINLKDKFLTKREIILFCIPLMVNTVMMIYSLFTGFVFTVDEFNEYHRGPGVILVALIDYSTILVAFYFVMVHRKAISRKFIVIAVAFCLFPLTGSVLQILFYGISTSWPSMTLGILMTYIFMEVQKSVRDHLTGLVNRQQYEEIIHSLMTKPFRFRVFSLIVIDMNRFKEINDTHGHEAGDRALQAAAMLLNRSVNIKDTVVRLGGDEFVIILESKDESLVRKVILRINDHVDQWNRETDEPFRLSMSLGYSVYDSHRHGNYKELFTEADEMMYRNKRQMRKEQSSSES